MDKENLYYAVIKGTNYRGRAYKRGGDIIIGYDKQALINIVEEDNMLFNKTWEVMSIREYEEKFTEKEPEVSKLSKSAFDEAMVLIEKIKESFMSVAVNKDPAPYNLYSTGKHLFGMYNNKVIVLFAGGPMWGYVYKIITDPEIVKNILDYTKYSGPLKEHAEELIEELIGKAA